MCGSEKSGLLNVSSSDYMVSPQIHLLLQYISFFNENLQFKSVLVQQELTSMKKSKYTCFQKAFWE